MREIAALAGTGCPLHEGHHQPSECVNPQEYEARIDGNVEETNTRRCIFVETPNNPSEHENVKQKCEADGKDEGKGSGAEMVYSPFDPLALSCFKECGENGRSQREQEREQNKSDDQRKKHERFQTNPDGFVADLLDRSRDRQEANYDNLWDPDREGDD
ncbi:MAG: hypothetical protein V1495_08510 [Pseudomonadota bacterium]